MEGASMVFLCVGLGGGTGSGAAPLIASFARAQGALVVVFARCHSLSRASGGVAQAEEALASLQHYADVVICFENDRMGDAVSPRAGIQEAFLAADQTISQSVRAIAQLVQRPGLVRVGFDELRTALRAQNPRCLFGYGEAEGDNRAHAALERALKSPLMDRGRMLEEAENILVNVIGGPNLTLNEVQILMEELNRHVSDHTRLLFGTAVEPRMGNRMAVMLLSAMGGEVSRFAAAAPLAAQPEPAAAAPEPVVNFVAEDPAPVHAEPPPELVVLPTPEPPRVAARVAPGMRAPRTNEVAAIEAAKAREREVKQEQLSFEPVTRGRFEKSEPTIVDGQDLDVPAFMRRNVRLK